jgi:hypothetical protein
MAGQGMSERALAEVDAPHSVRLPSERNSFVKKPRRMKKRGTSSVPLGGTSDDRETVTTIATRYGSGVPGVGFGW